MWEHLTTITDPSNVEGNIKAQSKYGGWEVCGMVTKASGMVLIVHKRQRPAPRTPEENGQGYEELIEHHKQHHLEEDTYLEELQAIQSRAEKELERIGSGGAVWQALRYVLGINGT